MKTITDSIQESGESRKPRLVRAWLSEDGITTEHFYKYQTDGTCCLVSENKTKGMAEPAEGYEVLSWWIGNATES